MKDTDEIRDSVKVHFILKKNFKSNQFILRIGAFIK